ncbi:uncharacterized protein LOC116188220 [Punica granatum]|uniref:Uncharacterized protein LOC116188220 n=2 Tax=Punica granatum TaxID=22663 RepID=A0A6P8BSF1_PUNGR|nr:uncharacterized protein LOC116188220 [Punica granatum]PKI77969.1 hypothetical protein CRG98_001589 [Punica granatum]
MAEEDDSPMDLPELKQGGCSMVVIRKKSEWNVFPPINHENLQVSSRLCKEEDGEEEQGQQNTPSSFSPLSSDSLSSPSSSSITSSSSMSSFPPLEDGDEVVPEDTHRSDSTVRVREVGDVSGWWRIGFGVLRSKVWGIVGWPFWCGIAARGRALWSFAPAAAVLLWLLYVWLRLWRWRNQRLRTEERLACLVKEKDEKIAQLLNQIAQMNELLISRHSSLAPKLATRR